MDNSKLSPAIKIALKICVVLALIIGAATKQPYDYYNFIRWLLLISFIYLGYKSYEQKQYGLVIYFILVAVLFNPFHKFWFKKETWHLIDYIIAGITALTIAYDLFSYKKFNKEIIQ